MNPAAKNAWRIVGIVVTVMFTLTACGILLLLSLCAGDQHGQASGFVLGAIFSLVIGVVIIVALARGIARTNRELAAAFAAHSAGTSAIAPIPPALEKGPLKVTPAGLVAIDYLAYAVGARLVVSVITWALNIAMVSNALRSVPHGRMIWTTFLSFILYNIPYAILLYFLFQKLTRQTLYYALAVPAVQLVMGLSPYLVLLSSHYARAPRVLLTLLISTCLEILVFVLAMKVARKNQVAIDPQGATIAGVVVFGYFMALHVIVPFLYLIR